MKKQLLILIVLATIGSSLLKASSSSALKTESAQMIEATIVKAEELLRSMAGSPKNCVTNVGLVLAKFAGIRAYLADLDSQIATCKKNEKELSKMLETTMAQLKEIMGAVQDLSQATAAASK